jgi:hypothetical protein
MDATIPPTTCNYYVGLRIKESPGHHSTIIYLKAVTEDVVCAVIDTITRCFEKNPFVGAVLLLGDEDMMGPEKDIRVRKLTFDLASKSGQAIFDLSKALYETYGNKTYGQNPHISANGTEQDEIIFTSESVIADQIYVERRGPNPEVIHVVDVQASDPEQCDPLPTQTWQPPTLEELNSDETIGVLYNACYGGFVVSAEVVAAFDEAGIPHDWTGVERTDQRAVEIIRRIPNRNGRHSDIRVRIFPKPLSDFVSIQEYDGSETVTVDWKRAFKAAQQMIKNGQLTSAAEVDQHMQRFIDLTKTSYGHMTLAKPPVTQEEKQSNDE